MSVKRNIRQKKEGSDKNGKTEIVQSLDVRGSAVIEASVIVPFLLVVFIMTIQAAFFLYDECTAWQYCYIAAMRADTVTGQKNAKEALAGQFAKQLFEEGMMAVNHLKVTKEISGGKLTVYAAGDTAAGGGAETGYETDLGEGVWHFETKGEAVMLRPVEFIRRLQTGKDIWESIRGEEEAEETYDGI